MKPKRLRKIAIYSILSLFLIASISVYYCNNAIKRAATGKTFASITEIPYNHVGLLLGTSKHLTNGNINPYYSYRINAAKELFQSQKIKYLVISGDNGRKDYSEPEEMRADLIAAGIDSSLIYLDYAGFRTFDSMIRLKEIFGQSKATIISQHFHNERAIYIGMKEGIDCIAYDAKDVSKSFGFRVMLREKFARVKVFVDYLINTKPKFLGKQVNIPA